MATKEKLKTKAARAGEELRETGRLVLHAPALVRFAECVMRFLLGAMLSGAELFGGSAPFALAVVGASGSGVDGFSALLGACLGHLIFQGFTQGLRYVAAAILIFSVSFAFYDIRPYRTVWFMPVMAAAMNGVTGFVYLSERGWFTADAVYFVTELLLTGAFVYFYRTALSPWTEKREHPGLSVRQMVSLLLLGGSILITLAKIDLYGGISLGRLCAVLAVLCLASQGGLGLGTSAGLTAGLAMDLATTGVPFYSVAYAFAGLMTGVVARQGKLLAALACVLANAVSVLWTWNEGIQISSLYEVFIASVLFLLLPGRFFRWVGALTVKEGTGKADDRAQRYLSARLEATARAFRTLRDELRTAFSDRPNDNDAALIFDRTASRVCQNCALRDACWSRDYVSTYNALNDALGAMVERGRGEPGDFPPYFASRCLKFPAFLAAANEELTALLYRREYRSRLRESRETVARQYADLADILGGAAAELSGELSSDPVKEKRLRQHLAALGLEGEAAVYYDEHGRLRAEIEGRELDGLTGAEEEGRLGRLLGVPLRTVSRESAGRTERLVLAQAEPLLAVAGVAARKKDGETVSGDTGAWFKREDGVLFVLLCDGMGSGPEASRESALAVRLLEQFLQAGVAAEAALKTISSALALRGEVTGGFTTIDLLQVDLFTGEAAVYKYGAAPTYLRKGDRVTRFTGAALPAGLTVGEGGAPDVSRFRLEAGDWVLLVSDGVTAADEDLWLREALSAAEETAPRDLARALLERSAAQTAPGDDQTVLAVKIEKSKK